jgi:hypothetical protein
MSKYTLVPVQSLRKRTLGSNLRYVLISEVNNNSHAQRNSEENFWEEEIQIFSGILCGEIL